MKFSAGDEVIVKGTDLVGKIVRQRLNDNIYLVQIEHYYSGDALQSMKEAEAEQKADEAPEALS
jgi:dihydrofolate reductase